MRRGKEYEDIAVKYLENLGYTVLARNFHCRLGEI
ncbi:MAG TPA: YraN family protein, partial [Aquifex aeolicus]|nr:YraN family protein [Aquifex aeolicus]